MKRILFAALAALSLFVGCSRQEEVSVPRDGYVFAPLRTAAVYTALLEKPDARSVLLLGTEARVLTNLFTRAGTKCHTRACGRVDMLVIACGEMTRASCEKACALVKDDGVVAWLMDVRGVTMARFRAMLDAFNLGAVHFWALGDDRWLLTGRKVPRQVKLSALLELFTRENAYADLAAARCAGLPDLFAGYVGRREDVLPAFASGDPKAQVRPEYFLTREVPAVDWIVADADVDGDIRTRVLTEIRAMQNARRHVVEGNMLSAAARDKKGEEAAIEKWVRALRCNPNDLMLLERLDRLDRNARGFLEVGKVLMAMKCYETMVLVRPNDAAAVHNFGVCLKRLGKIDMAEKVLKHAQDLATAIAAER